MMEGEYEIRTDLPSARACCLESDEQDLSPTVITTARLILENWKRTSLRHTFFARLFFDRVVVGLGSGDSGASQIACPSSSCRLRMRCSTLCLNLKNMFSFPMRRRISPLPTSILALAALRNGRPRMSSIPRSPSISMTTKSARTKESRTRTRTFLAIPSRYQIVESASCTHMYVGGESRV